MGEADERFRLRLATREDIPLLRELIEKSVRVLQRKDYAAEQLEAALGTAYGVDTQLIADGTYYVVEATTDLIATANCWTRGVMRRRYGHFLCIRCGHGRDWLV